MHAQNVNKKKEREGLQFIRKLQPNRSPSYIQRVAIFNKSQPFNTYRSVVFNKSQPFISYRVAMFD